MARLSSDEFARLAGQGYNLIALTETLQLDRETPVSLYQRLADRAFFLLESAALGEATGRYSFLGLDRAWRVSAPGGVARVEGTEAPTGLSPLATVRHLLARYTTWTPDGLPDFTGGAVGFVSYDYVRHIERLPRNRGTDPWPDIDFSFPAALLIVDHLRHATTIVRNVAVEAGADPGAVYATASAELDGIVERLLGPAPVTNPDVEMLVATAPDRRAGVDIASVAAGLSNFTADEYCAVVEAAKAHIVAGDIFQVVLSQQFAKPTTVDPLTLYRVLRSLNPSPYMYLLNSGDSHLVGASPEMLVRVANGVVSTRPIAGTLPRGINEEDDRRLEHELLHNEKEIAEHVMLVDLGRNDIGRVSAPGTVKVERLAHIERFSHLMHIVSDVSGTLANGHDAFDAFDATFPAGTLSGAPKVRAMEIIDSFEPVVRSPYGGAVGYFSLSGSADFAITIRTVGLRDGVATVQAGGGIVKDSIPLNEYRECVNKASAPLLALAIAESVGAK